MSKTKPDYHARLICAVATALGQPPDEPIYTATELRATFPAETKNHAMTDASLQKLLKKYGEEVIKRAKKTGPERWPQWMRDRDYAIVAYLEQCPGGATFREAGAKFGVSRTTVCNAKKRVMPDRAATVAQSSPSHPSP
jgi:hypothetical protein